MVKSANKVADRLSYLRWKVLYRYTCSIATPIRGTNDHMELIGEHG